MTMYECLSLLVGILTLGVLSCTLCVLKEYAHDTKIIAKTSVEQFPRPCLVLKRSVDTSLKAIIAEETIGFLPNDDPTLTFVNVGTGPAVNCQYSYRDTEETEKEEVSWQQLPEIRPCRSFTSGRPVNVLPENGVVTIAYESIAGSPYRTEMTIETILNRKCVKKIIFSPESAGRLNQVGCLRAMRDFLKPS